MDNLMLIAVKYVTNLKKKYFMRRFIFLMVGNLLITHNQYAVPFTTLD